MSSASRRADEDSRGSEAENRAPNAPSASPEAADPPARAPFAVLTILAAAGIAALIASAFLPVLRISVDERVATALDRSGWDQHGAALVALALFAAALLPLAARGNAAAAGAIALTGLVAIAIVIATDLPDVGDVGSVGSQLDDGKVGTGLGAYAETLGGVLLLAAGGLMALRARRD